MNADSDSTGGRRGPAPSPYAAQVFTLRLDPALREGLEQAARHEGVPLRQFTRDVLQDYVERLRLRSA